MTNREQLRSEAFRAWARGITPETVASNLGIPLAEVEEIIQSRSELGPQHADPERVLGEHVARLDAIIEELAMIASREKGGARVRAVEARFRALAHKWELLAAAGRVPAEPDQWTALLDARRVGGQVIEVLEDHGVLTANIMSDIYNALVGPDGPQWDEAREEAYAYGPEAG